MTLMPLPLGFLRKPSHALALAAILLLTSSWSSLAIAWYAPRRESSAAFESCVDNSGGVTAEMLACLSREYKRLDRRLNVTYRTVMKQLPTQNLRTRLRNSQRVWIWRRDDQCQRKVDASGAKGGTAGDLIYSNCRVTMLRERIRWLNKVPANHAYLSKV